VNDSTSVSLTQTFLKAGYEKVYYLKGGWDDWSKAKYPTERK
jgi:3-mercaptopyruvate sulfurtransferase SseA